jgi:hypothetical protein
MRFAVEFDDQFCREANEIDDVILDGGLSAKAEAIDATSLEITP